MPRTTEQYEEIRETKKKLIMQTALELFASEGYYTTSISRIAQKAGIAKGLMYNYFKSKEELILAIIGDGIEKLMAGFDPNRDGILTDEEFEFLVMESFRILEENTDYWKLYFSTLMQPAVFRLMASKYADIVPKLTSVIKNYYERKGVDDPETEAQFFSAILDGVSMNYIMNPENFPLEKIKKLIIERFK